jgi:hypothetical protein
VVRTGRMLDRMAKEQRAAAGTAARKRSGS